MPNTKGKACLEGLQAQETIEVAQTAALRKTASVTGAEEAVVVAAVVSLNFINLM